MKNTILMLCLLLVTSSLPALAGRGSKVGGYSPACVTNQETIAIATFAVQAKEAALNKDKEKKEKLELVSILKAETQVVAGMNYKLELKVKREGKEKKALAVVWWQSWRKPDPYQLTSWEWQEETAKK